MSNRSTEAWVEPMQAALDEAANASAVGDVPIGAVIIDPGGSIVARAHNRREVDGDATAHAEILALREASERSSSWRLDGHTVVVTLEPCPMCAMAAVLARVDRIVYGAADLKAGGVWSLYNIPQDERLNHRCEVVHGVLEAECSEILREFFERRRDS